jgi:nucleoside-diphosphate-sugar epimerase
MRETGSTLPAAVPEEEQLEELLSRPSAADVAFARTLSDDVMILGAGGKMGPSLARRVRRACEAAGVGRRVLAVSRFSDRRLPRALESDGIEPLECDLLDAASVARLPQVGNVLYLAGRKFGSTDRPDLTWAQNVVAPFLAASHLAASRIVAFSTGNVYPFVGPDSPGSTEDDPPGPVGEYAQTCLGRERVLAHVSREKGTRVVLFRLFYAVDLRYGTIVDVARRVLAGEPVSLRVPRVNAIWQGDANSYAFRALALAEAPPRPLVATGPPLDVRELARRFGRLLDRPVRFEGDEGDRALLGHPALCASLLGPPEVDTDRLVEWTAGWVARGGRSLGKPTHFEATDGRF